MREKSESVVLNVFNVSLPCRKLRYACKGSFTLSESERKNDFFFDRGRWWIWTLNWILYEPIWKRCRFRFHPNV